MRSLAVIALTAAAVLAACTKKPHDLPPPPAVAKPVAKPPPPRQSAPPPYQHHGAMLSSDGMGAPDPANHTAILLGSRVVYDADFGTIYTGTVQMKAASPGVELAHEAARVLTAAERSALDPLIAQALAEPPHQHDAPPDFTASMLVWDGTGVGHRMDGPGFDPAANKLAETLEALARIKPPHRSHGTPRAKLPGAILADAPVRGIYDAVHHVIYDRDAGTIAGGNVSRHVTDAMRGQLAGAMAAGWDAPAGNGLVLLDGDQVHMLDASGSIAARTIEVLRDGRD